MVKMNEAFLRGEDYTPQGEPITEYPEKFKDWIRDNADKIRASQHRGTEPYFVRNNAKIIDNIVNPKSPFARPAKAIPTVEETLSKVTEADFYDNYGGSLESGSRSGRTLQGYVSELMGRNGAPQFASASEFDELAKDKENIVLYRGFRENEAENIHNYKYGKAYDGNGGMGEGQYFATTKLKEFSATGEYIEAILDPRTAKIGDYSTLEAQWNEERKAFRAKGRPAGVDRDDWNLQKEIYNDFGRWATLKGYDAYTTSDSRFKEYVILNREALIVKDVNAVKGASLKRSNLKMATSGHQIAGVSNITVIEQNHLSNSIRSLSKKANLFENLKEIQFSDNLEDGVLMAWRDGTLTISKVKFELNNGTIFCPADELKRAVFKLAKGETLTFNEEYAIEALYHENVHSKATTIFPKTKGKFTLEKGTIDEVIAEACTQLYARENYRNVLKKYGVDALNYDVIKYDGYGYKETCNLLREHFTKEGKIQVGELINVANETASGSTILKKKLRAAGWSKSEIKDLFYTLSYYK